jgi:hypothetical protein
LPQLPCFFRLILYVIRGIIAYRILPVPFGLKYVDRATFRTMANYSGVTLIIMIATQLKFKTDNIVIGTMISAAAVTYFSYWGAHCELRATGGDGAGAEFSAAGQPVRSHRETWIGCAKCSSRATGSALLPAFPITVTLLILGKSVIEVWVGKKYVATSYSVMVVLIIPATLMWAQAASGRVLFGISKHRTWAFVTLGEGIANLILSVILVRPYGIMGDAWERRSR